MKKYPFKKEQDLIDGVIETLFENPSLKRFFLDHDLSHDDIENDLNLYMTFAREQPLCLECEGLDFCQQDTLGYQPELTFEGGRARLSYKACNFLRDARQKEKAQSRLKALYMPQMILAARLEDFHMKTDARQTLYKRIMGIVNQAKLNEPLKGLYITGPYQIGKTYALGALANELAGLGREVIIAYYPDLVREVKSSLRTGELETIVRNLKTVDVLLLDDIGGEAPSSWVRDEVLGPVLQHRLLDHKPTFFSSNLPMKELANALIDTDQQADKIKAYRMIERIKALADEIVLK